MVIPTIDDLLEKVDSKYSLVVVAAKRAREIVDGAEYDKKELEKNASKPVTIALNEVGKELIGYQQISEGLK